MDPRENPPTYNQEPAEGQTGQIVASGNTIVWISAPTASDLSLSGLAANIARSPATASRLPGNVSLVLIQKNPNHEASFTFRGKAAVHLQRGDKATILSKTATGLLLPSDRITFFLQEKPTAKRPTISFSRVPRPTGRLVRSFLAQISWPAKPALLFPLLAVFLIMTTFIFYQLRSRDQEIKLAEWEKLTQTVKIDLSDSAKLGEINPHLAKKQLTQTKERFLATVTRLRLEEKQTSPLLIELEAAINHWGKIYHLDALPVFYDVTIVKKDARISLAAVSGQKMVMLDQPTGTLLELDLVNKAAAVVAGEPDLKTARLMSGAGGKTAVLTATGVALFPKSTGSFSVADAGKVASLRLFAGNAYLLLPATSEINKHAPAGDSFTGPRPYLAKGTAVKLEKAVDMVIDGAVYVLTSDGAILKFASGNPAEFTIKNLEPALNDPVSLFTNDETANLYILDSGNNRVVVLTKIGDYVAQYLFPTNSNLQPRIVLASEEIKKIFLFEGSKVYGIEIK